MLKPNILDEITDYIQKNLKKGYTKESLRWALVDQGYSKMLVERAFKKVDRNLANKAPLLKTKPVIKHEIITKNSEVEKLKQQSMLKKIFRE